MSLRPSITTNNGFEQRFSLQLKYEYLKWSNEINDQSFNKTLPHKLHFILMDARDKLRLECLLLFVEQRSKNCTDGNGRDCFVFLSPDINDDSTTLLLLRCCRFPAFLECLVLECLKPWTSNCLMWWPTRNHCYLFYVRRSCTSAYRFVMRRVVFDTLKAKSPVKLRGLFHLVSFLRRIIWNRADWRNWTRFAFRLRLRILESSRRAVEVSIIYDPISVLCVSFRTSY